MLRGNNRGRIFVDSYDFEYFLKIIKESKAEFKLRLYNYVLMDNHVHMILMAKEGKQLSDFIKKLNVTYVRYYRKKHKGIGHFFQDRYKSYIIQEGKYLLECGRYIEYNPVKAGLVNKPEKYQWSSYGYYIGIKKDDIVDISPAYESLSENEKKRMVLYQEFVSEGDNEKRNEERYFKEGAYGSKEFIQALKVVGMHSHWSHGGRPKKGRKT